MTTQAGLLRPWRRGSQRPPLERIKKERLPCERPQGSYFHDPDLMNNMTKTAKGDEMTSQASSSSLPIIQPSIQLMPQLSKRFFVADKAETLFSFRLTLR